MGSQPWTENIGFNLQFGLIPGFHTHAYRGLLFIETNLCGSGPVQFKPILFKCLLFHEYLEEMGKRQKNVRLDLCLPEESIVH